MFLTIDIGNSRTKVVAFEEGQPVEYRISEGMLPETALASVAGCSLEAAIVSSVRDIDAGTQTMLDSLSCPLLHFTSQTPTPLVNAYHTPATLGSDRLAAAVGAWTAHRGRNLLVIDSGSCITFDLVSAQGEFLGGNISLGLHTRLRAIYHFFPRLPLVEAEGSVPELGYDTQTAIRAGVLEGMRYEIEGYIHHFKEKYADLLVFLTGGDEFHFAEPMKSGIFADPFIVSRGLEAVLRHNLGLKIVPKQ